MKPASPPTYAIPTTANLALLAVCSILYFVLLYVAARADSIAAVLGCGACFAVVMIPIYSLIHEAEHSMLHPDQRWNDRLGLWLCTLFVVSFTFFKHCHFRHHTKNRTDVEMWDLYLDEQEKWKRFGNLYLMMIGLGYFALWLSVVLFALAPPVVYGGFFDRHTEIAGFLSGSNQPEKVRRVRAECWAVIGFHAVVFALLGLEWKAWLILFALHGFVWSSQTYVNHAFSPRDIINGAHNLKLPVWLRPIYLNFNLHLAHHQNPRIPWIHLPHFITRGPGRINFYRNYLRLWKGPRLTREPNPTLRPADRAKAIL